MLARAERAIAGAYPALYAIWAELARGERDACELAAALGTTPARVSLIAEVVEWLLTRGARRLARGGRPGRDRATGQPAE